ncbi:CBS domain containing-hemolysin-like protein [Pseudonocardia hierapolitana]|uniref:CBS domain containing-hemolysin-like protein n=1 Tax=Pseudonocardia hierapolitana TaxID=1128676 RepID=A0A561SKK8_9PSEU|nr:hemolysin family protein [Pseudonocardia hierapolitana]TWF75400.1 CBS domain containing-hemolysin-like protein [Pseudonocardia hierapolitana]
MTILSILLGVLTVVGLTVLTGYFVAQEFGYMAVDRSRLQARASAGDAAARRALGITRRTSFMLSGAQLGITVTGLLAGYVAEPMIGDGVAELLGGTGVPAGAGLVIGAVVALVVVTVVQMVFGELFPKNLAIARPEPVARALAYSTSIYLAAFGWLIRLFDAASNVLLKALRIEPVHDVEHAATPRDLEAIIDESRDSGDLDDDLSTLLDRVLDFTDRTARAAMIPRPRVTSVRAGAPISELVEVMASGHSRLPVIGENPDDVVGVICLRDVLALEGRSDLATLRVIDVARTPVLVLASLPLPTVLDRLRGADDEFAVVVDEYGGLAGVITVEDIAEELVGEITDEHDPAGADGLAANDGEWTVPGTLSVEEVERLLDADLPDGEYQTIGGLVIDELQRLPEPGDGVRLRLENPSLSEEGEPPRTLEITVLTVERHVPSSVRLAWAEAEVPA